MRRLALVAAGLLLPLLPAAPAFAVDHVICVLPAVGTCDQTVASIPAAITAAGSNGLTNTIQLGAATYSDGPYQLDGSTHALTLRGAGQGSTVLTLPASASALTYVSATHATVRDLTIEMAAANSGNDKGLSLVSASAQRVTVIGTGTTGATGIQTSATGPTGSTISASSVQMPVAAAFSSRGVYSNGLTTITDTAISGNQGYLESAPNLTDTLSRLTIRADYEAISTDQGTVNVDDTLIDLGPAAGAPSGIGLLAANFNPGTVDKAINADHVTIVGGGSGSRGAYASAAYPTVTQHATIQLDNSIVRGPETDLVADASNNGGPLAQSTATINVSYTDWTAPAGGTIGTNGGGGVVPGGGNLDVDPAFVNAAGGDYHLTAGSPVVDKGDPGAGGPALDLGGSARVSDGDGNGTAVRDLGAYELKAVKVPAVDTTAPATTITRKPAKRVTTRRVRFAFTASEAGATFTCKLDRRVWRACTSPTRFRVKVGRHRFLVRATDAAGNTDATPATYRFRRVR